MPPDNRLNRLILSTRLRPAERHFTQPLRHMPHPASRRPAPSKPRRRPATGATSAMSRAPVTYGSTRSGATAPARRKRPHRFTRRLRADRMLAVVGPGGRCYIPVIPTRRARGRIGTRHGTMTTMSGMGWTFVFRGILMRHAPGRLRAPHSIRIFDWAPYRECIRLMSGGAGVLWSLNASFAMELLGSLIVVRGKA